MPPFRNPFNKKAPLANGLTPVNDENKRPSLATDSASQGSSYGGSRTSSSLSIKRREEPSEYKLSGNAEQVRIQKTLYWPALVVNDSGVYLPVRLFDKLFCSEERYTHELTAIAHGKERLLG